MKRSKKKAIYITGCSFANKGPEAMILTTVGAIRRRWPDMDIFVQVPSLYFDEARSNRLIPVKSDRPALIVSSLLSKIQMARVYCKSAALVDLGGYQFGDVWGENHAWKMLNSIKNCTRFGNTVFFLPQTWGPFSSASIIDAVRSIVDIAEVVYTRDRSSFAEMEKVMGGKNPKIRFAHDVAWNFQGADLSVGARLIRDAGLSEKKKGSITVCVTPNLRVYERAEGTGQDNEYIKVLREIVKHLCSVYNARVILIGHELRKNNMQIKDDRILCDCLLSTLDKSLPVVHLNKYLPAAEVKSVIGNCDLSVSSRYHALIAALSQGIPAVAIGWAHKYDELMSEFGLSENLISLSKTTDVILKDIDAVVERLGQCREKIVSKVGIMKKSGQEAVNEVISKLEERFKD
jgi:colanic acid/amylovoran biosynthesis protein